MDDEATLRTAVRLTLEDAGHPTLEASNGRDGLEALRAADGPLVVLLDLMMPGGSGLWVLRTLRREPDLAADHVFILFSAARAFTAAVLATYLPQRRLFTLPKPFTLDELLTTVACAADELEQVTHRSLRSSRPMRARPTWP
jgi:CheY-like chemotaxis protein